MSISARQTVKEDKSTFLSLMNEFYHSAAVLHPLPSEVMESCFDDSVSQSPYVKSYLFENEDGGAVGFAIITLGYSSEAGGRCVWIEDIYLKEEYRGLGFGKAFIEGIKKEYSGVAKRVRLEVEKDNFRAVSLYKKCGFENLPYLQYIMEI